VCSYAGLRTCVRLCFCVFYILYSSRIFIIVYSFAAALLAWSVDALFDEPAGVVAGTRCVLGLRIYN